MVCRWTFYHVHQAFWGGEIMARSKNSMPGRWRRPGENSEPRNESIDRRYKQIIHSTYLSFGITITTIHALYIIPHGLFITARSNWAVLVSCLPHSFSVIHRVFPPSFFLRVLLQCMSRDIPTRFTWEYDQSICIAEYKFLVHCPPLPSTPKALYLKRLNQVINGSSDPGPVPYRCSCFPRFIYIEKHWPDVWIKESCLYLQTESRCFSNAILMLTTYQDMLLPRCPRFFLATWMNPNIYRFGLQQYRLSWCHAYRYFFILPGSLR